MKNIFEKITQYLLLRKAKKNPLYYADVKEQPEKVSWELLTTVGVWVFKYIKNPTDEMKLYALELDGKLIRYIENPTEEMQLIAIKQNPFLIKYIENPTELVQRKITSYGGLDIMGYIKNPSSDTLEKISEKITEQRIANENKRRNGNRMRNETEQTWITPNYWSNYMTNPLFYVPMLGKPILYDPMQHQSQSWEDNNHHSCDSGSSYSSDSGSSCSSSDSSSSF